MCIFAEQLVWWVKVMRVCKINQNRKLRMESDATFLNRFLKIMFQIQTSSLPLCHHFSLWPLSSTRAAKWRTHVKQAQEITSHSISACCSSVSGSRDGVRLLLCAPTGLLLIEADVDCVSHTCPRKGHLGQVKTSQPRSLPSSAFYRRHCYSGCSVWSFVIGFSAGERQSSSRNREKGWLPWVVCHGRNVETDMGGKGGWLVAFKSDLFEKQQRGLVPKTQRQ